MQKILIVSGLAITLIGLLWPLLFKMPFGRLPGDIIINRPNFKFYFPLTTLVIINLIIALILWIFRK